MISCFYLFIYFFLLFWVGGGGGDTDQNYHFIKPSLPALVQHQFSWKLSYICTWALLHCLQIIMFLNLRCYTDGMNFLIAPKQRWVFSLSLAVSVVDTVRLLKGLLVFLLCIAIVINYLYQQMCLKYIRLQVFCIHKLSYLFQRMFAIFREMEIQYAIFSLRTVSIRWNV